jgi:hypothetical protein
MILLIPAIVILAIPPASARAESPAPIREINYYPRDYAWEQFWPHWEQARPLMDDDLDRMQSLRANTVRIFVHPFSVGYPIPTSQFLNDFEDALDLIQAHGLEAHVTLFDCWWSWQEIANSRAWLSHIVGSHRNDSRIALWELQNEVQLDNPAVRTWIQSLLPDLKQQAGATPITVSVGNIEWLDDVRDLAGATPPDIYSLHWYPSEFWWTQPFPSVLNRVRELIGQADLLLGEFGYNTYSLSEASQTLLYHDILYASAQKGVHDLGAWTLNDFPDGTAQCAGVLPSPTEWHFGLYRPDGSARPAAAVLKAAFHGHVPAEPAPVIVHNPSFEHINPYSGQAENWHSWDQNWSGNQTFVQDCTMAHAGSCSAKVHGPANLVVGLYSLPVLPVQSGQSWSLHGYVQTQNLDGWAKLVFSWFDSDQQWLDRDTSSLLVTDPNLAQWTHIFISPVVPPQDAAFVQVFAQAYTTNPATYVWFDEITTQPNKLYMPYLWRRP